MSYMYITQIRHLWNIINILIVSVFMSSHFFILLWPSWPLTSDTVCPLLSLQVSLRTMNTWQVWWCRWFEQLVDSGYLDQLSRPSNACQVKHTHINTYSGKDWLTWTDLNFVFFPQWFWRISFTRWQFLDRKFLWSNVRTTSRNQSAFRDGHTGSEVEARSTEVRRVSNSVKLSLCLIYIV